MSGPFCVQITLLQENSILHDDSPTTLKHLKQIIEYFELQGTGIRCKSSVRPFAQTGIEI